MRLAELQRTRGGTRQQRLVMRPTAPPIAGLHPGGDPPRDGRGQNEARRDHRCMIQKPASALSAGHVSTSVTPDPEQEAVESSM